MSEPLHQNVAHKNTFPPHSLAELAAAVLVPLALLAFVRCAGFKTENSVDAYYHVALADFGPSYYTSRRIPHLTMSVWKDAFSDKELGYHLILTGLRAVLRTLGISGRPPFNIEALFFDLLLLSSFVLACAVFGVERRTVIFFSVTLVVISPFFANRLLMLRPHNLSIALMLTACALFHATRGWRVQLPLSFALGFAAAWCYSNPHFLLLPALAFGIANSYFRGINKIEDSASDQPSTTNVSTPLSPAIPRFPLLGALSPAAAVLAGIAAGYVCHPQFPYTFSNWWIQCVEVPWQALSHSTEIALGNEFRRPSALWLLKNALPYLLLASSAAVFVKLVAAGGGEMLYSRFRRMDPTAAAVSAIAAISAAATAFGIRAMEYACPLILLSLAANLAALKRAGIPPPKFFSGPRFFSRVKSLLAVSSAAFVVFQTEIHSERRSGGPLDDFAAYMKDSGIPRGTVVANLAWSDYPFLLHSCPEYKYISGMDPMFSYAFAPERMVALEKFRRGELKLPRKDLKKLTGARYLFLRRMYANYADKLRCLGCRTRYDGPDGWLFEIPDQVQRKNATPPSCPGKRVPGVSTKSRKKFEHPL